MDSLAAMHWPAHESEALSAIGAALSEQELDEARVKFLGRKSELAQALRGVRDRESGMLLNGIRSKLEEAVATREAELTRLAYELYDYAPEYHRVVWMLRTSNGEGRQLALLVPGWLHGCLGLPFAFCRQRGCDRLGKLRRADE